MDIDEYLQLAEWRRTVAALYERWRNESGLDPEAATARWRLARDELFRSHAQSPLPIDERARFGGLSYYPYDPAYRMTATVESFADPADPADLADPPDGKPAALLQLPTSGDKPFSFRRIGQVALSGPLAGSVLPVFWMEGYAGGLFVPFRDATAGAETYGAGRYLLDSVKGADHGGDPQQRELLLDFNLAYHPSCVYDPRWNCPLAPLESRLGVPIRAGERLAV
ncbi:MAG: DUF1684 domain-containing protein [Chloroflexota bacterium]